MIKYTKIDDETIEEEHVIKIIKRKKDLLKTKLSLEKNLRDINDKLDVLK